MNYYKELIDAGINDFSISLDACCSSNANIMAGTDAKFDKLINNITELSKITYVTVGVVLTEKNNNDLKNIIHFSTSLGVSDIRIIPSAQTNQFLI